MTATLEMAVTADPQAVDWDQWAADRVAETYAIAGAARSGDWATALGLLRKSSAQRNVTLSTYCNDLYARGIGWRAMARALGVDRSTIEGRYRNKRVPVHH